MLSKKIVTNLLGQDNPFGDMILIWSPDSKWFAFYSSYIRVGDTEVYHRSGDEFVLALQTDDDEVHAEKGLKGVDVRNEYVRPIRWTKPGVLVLEHYLIFRGDKGDTKFELTAGVDPKSGKFQILSKRKIFKNRE